MCSRSTLTDVLLSSTPPHPSPLPPLSLEELGYPSRPPAKCPLAGGRSLSYTGQHLSMCVSAASCGLRAICYAQLFLSLASVVPLPNFPCCCI